MNLKIVGCKKCYHNLEISSDFPQSLNKLCPLYLIKYSKRVRSCDVCADAYCDYYESSGADKDCVDAPPEYREVKGDELNQYEAEEEEEIKEEETKIEESEGT